MKHQITISKDGKVTRIERYGGYITEYGLGDIGVDVEILDLRDKQQLQKYVESKDKDCIS